jgi:hypothetical protein
MEKGVPVGLSGERREPEAALETIEGELAYDAGERMPRGREAVNTPACGSGGGWRKPSAHTGLRRKPGSWGMERWVKPAVVAFRGG